jgi:hypothetical protein
MNTMTIQFPQQLTSNEIDAVSGGSISSVASAFLSGVAEGITAAAAVARLLM